MADCTPPKTPFIRGPMGPIGHTGLRGVQGAQGVQGSTQIIGEDGPQGAQGSQGAQGTAGVAGTQGSIGVQGSQGATGSGAQGAQGVQGATGGTAPEGARVTKSTDTVLAAYTPEILTWDTAINNSNGVYSGGSPTKLTAITGGWYALSASITWNTEVYTTFSWVLSARKNGSTYVGRNEFYSDAAGTGGVAIFNKENKISELIFLNAADYIEIIAETTEPDDRNTILSLSQYSPVFELVLTQGVTGPQGTAGTNGTNGAQGATGATGAAFEIDSFSDTTSGSISTSTVFPGVAIAGASVTFTQGATGPIAVTLSATSSFNGGFHDATGGAVDLDGAGTQATGGTSNSGLGDGRMVSVGGTVVFTGVTAGVHTVNARIFYNAAAGAPAIIQRSTVFPLRLVVLHR